MVYLLIGCVLVAAAVIVFRRLAVPYAYAKGILIAIGLSVVAVVCLAQNYTQSLIPEANDGIGVSNRVAYWIAGEDGWSIERFRELFEQSVVALIGAVLLYPLAVIAESRFAKRRT